MHVFKKNLPVLTDFFFNFFTFICKFDVKCDTERGNALMLGIWKKSGRVQL